MKKRKLILILGILGGLLFLTFNFLMPQASKNAFVVEPKSDFYIVASNSIVSYQLDHGNIKERNQSSVNLPDVVISGFEKGEFDNRYFVFSGGDGSDFSDDERLVSLDFKDGKVKQVKSPNYAYSGSGKSDKFFYTFQSTTEDGGLYQFDKQLKETASYLFKESTTAAVQFSGKAGKLYLTATQPSKVDEQLYQHYLFTFDENTLELLDKKLLDDNPEVIYGLTSMTILDNYVYSPIAEIRDRSTYERNPNNTFLAYNLNTGEKQYFTLPADFPHLVYTSKMGKYLMFTHEPHSLQKSALSVFNRETKQSYLIDVGEILGNHDVMESQIMSVNTDKQNRLFILTKVGLIVWNMEENKLISKTTNVDNSAFYVWVNE